MKISRIFQSEIAASIILLAAILVTTWLVFNGRTARPPEKDDSSTLPGDFYPSQGNRYLNLGERFNDYTSDPPTSGPHLPISAPWGVLKFRTNNRELLENMEQGGIVIRYDSSSYPGLVASLEAIAQSYLDHDRPVVMVPYKDMETRLALTGWTRLMKLDDLDEEAIQFFIEAHERRYRLKKS